MGLTRSAFNDNPEDAINRIGSKQSQGEYRTAEGWIYPWLGVQATGVINEDDADAAIIAGVDPDDLKKPYVAMLHVPDFTWEPEGWDIIFDLIPWNMPWGNFSAGSSIDEWDTSYEINYLQISSEIRDKYLDYFLDPETVSDPDSGTIPATTRLVEAATGNQLDTIIPWIDQEGKVSFMMTKSMMAPGQGFECNSSGTSQETNDTMKINPLVINYNDSIARNVMKDIVHYACIYQSAYQYEMETGWREQLIRLALAAVQIVIIVLVTKGIGLLGEAGAAADANAGEYGAEASGTASSTGTGSSTAGTASSTGTGSSTGTAGASSTSSGLVIAREFGKEILNEVAEEIFYEQAVTGASTAVLSMLDYQGEIMSWDIPINEKESLVLTIDLTKENIAENIGESVVSGLSSINMNVYGSTRAQSRYEKLNTEEASEHINQYEAINPDVLENVPITSLKRIEAVINTETKGARRVSLFYKLEAIRTSKIQKSLAQTFNLQILKSKFELSTFPKEIRNTIRKNKHEIKQRIVEVITNNPDENIADVINQDETIAELTGFNTIPTPTERPSIDLKFRDFKGNQWIVGKYTTNEITFNEMIYIADPNTFKISDSHEKVENIHEKCEGYIKEGFKKLGIDLETTATQKSIPTATNLEDTIKNIVENIKSEAQNTKPGLIRIYLKAIQILLKNHYETLLQHRKRNEIDNLIEFLNDNIKELTQHNNIKEGIAEFQSTQGNLHLQESKLGTPEWVKSSDAPDAKLGNYLIRKLRNKMCTERKIEEIAKEIFNIVNSMGIMIDGKEFIFTYLNEILAEFAGNIGEETNFYKSEEFFAEFIASSLETFGETTKMKKLKKVFLGTLKGPEINNLKGGLKEFQDFMTFSYLAFVLNSLK
ncbi:MAG: hypothetical protein ACTSRA_20930, partial [Promethearchaeota archaeon]